MVAVKKYFKENKFDQIYPAAAKVGGIEANRSFPVDFILDNLKIQTNILESAHIYDVNKVLFWARHVYIQNYRNSQLKRITFFPVILSKQMNHMQ